MKILDVIEHKTTITYKTNLVEAKAASIGDNFPLGAVVPLDGVGGNTWAIGLGTDEVIQFSSDTKNKVNGETAARNFLKSNEGLFNKEKPAINQIKSAAADLGDNVKVRNLSGFFRSLSTRAASASASTYQALQKIPAPVVGGTLEKVLASKVWTGLFRAIGAVGLPYAAITNAIEIINDLEREAQEDPSKEKELLELRNILVGQLSVQLLAILIIIFRNAQYIKRALGPIKWTVRAIQGGGVVSGVGTIPTLVSMLVTEAAWLAAGFIVTSATVQRKLAEYFHGMAMGEILGFLGAGVVAGVQVLDNLTDGAFGTAEMRRSLGWDPDSADAPEGEMTTSSEWAKLVFHGLLFPPGAKKYKVPYIAPQERVRMLQDKMGIQPAPPQDNQPSVPGLPENPDAPPGPQ